MCVAGTLKTFASGEAVPYAVSPFLAFPVSKLILVRCNRFSGNKNSTSSRSSGLSFWRTLAYLGQDALGKARVLAPEMLALHRLR